MSRPLIALVAALCLSSALVVRLGAAAPPTAERCDDCIDDDGDGAVDRADDDCTSPSDGGGAGLQSVAAAKTLERCAQVLQKAGAKLAWTRLGALDGCLDAARACVQTKAGDPACRSRAVAACARRMAKLGLARAALEASLRTACSAPALTADDLLQAVGIGFAGEHEPCARRDVAGLATIADVAACIRRQHECLVDRVVGIARPRAGELLAFAGRDPVIDTPCLPPGSDGGGAVAEPRRKALRKCDDAIQRAVQRLVRARLKSLQGCSAGVFRCLQSRVADPGCLPRARARCTGAFDGLPELERGATALVVRGCGVPPLTMDDVLAGAGLGFGGLAERCAALGTTLSTSTNVAACLVREVQCRTVQMLENETPRFVELVGAGGQTLAPTPTPTGTPVPTPSPSPTFPADFWDASGIPPAENVMVFKFLNRTNGQYDDAHVFWSVEIGGVTTTHSIAEQPFFDMPAHSSGRIYVYLGKLGKTPTDYYDFLEYTIGPNAFNGNTTRVDAFGVKLAFRLHCADGFEATVGEDARTFAEDRATTFQRFLDAVPTEFDALAELQAPYRILNPGWGGFDAGGPHADYYAAYIDAIWAANRLTIPKAGPNASGLGPYPDLSAAIYRHTAGPDSFAPDGKLLDQKMWADAATFYRQAPADFYAKFWHDNAIDGKAYGFPYDDVGSYSSFVSHQDPVYALVAIGW